MSVDELFEKGKVFKIMMGVLVFVNVNVVVMVENIESYDGEVLINKILLV